MTRLALFALPVLLFTGCAEDTAPEEDTAEPDPVAVAQARLDPLGESSATGMVTFTETPDGLRVEYDLTGIELGEHGLHVHEGEGCGRGDDGTLGGAAGGHFNPMDAPHGSRESDRQSRHVGDLGNVTSVAGGVTGGVAQGEFVDPLIALSGPTSIVGRTMVLHMGEDDLTSQPSGDAGDRIACGPIALAPGS